jgi:DNA-binding PucR family transcriptional regulator
MLGREPEKAFRGQIKTLVRNLERSVQDLLEHFWEEPLRRHTQELANALLEGCKVYGFLELASVMRAITSLVALPMEEVLTLEAALKEKLTELIDLLKEMAELIAA